MLMRTTVPFERLILLLALSSVLGEDYWHAIVRQLGEKHTTIGSTIRSHCGRNRYDKELPVISQPHKRIVGGELSRVAEWPWLVSLQLKPNSNIDKRFPHDLESLEEFDLNNKLEMEEIEALIAQMKLRLKEISPEKYAETEDIFGEDPALIKPLDGHTCGGALISPFWILTAKHCFEQKWNPSLSNDPKRWVAVLGEHHLLEAGDYQDSYDVAKIITYPESDDLEDELKKGGIVNDIALVKLSRPARLNEYVQLACLPYPEEKFRGGQLCSVAGWGVTEEDGEISELLQHIHIPLLTRETCENKFINVSTVLQTIRLESSVLCAGGQGGKDACQFDSGGPLVCRSEGDNLWVVAGIVSYGVRCASEYPGIYTRVSHFVPWIRQVISEE